MSGLAASLFRPGAGERIQEFTSAVANGAMYPTDIVAINATDAPAAQGTTAGEFEGKDLGTYDYIEVELTDISEGGSFPVGVVMGKGINEVSNWSDVSGYAIADGDVIVIQRRGIVPQIKTDGSVALGDYLVTLDDGTADGSATVVAGTFGIALTTDAAYTRSGADTGCIAYISC